MSIYGFETIKTLEVVSVNVLYHEDKPDPDAEEIKKYLTEQFKPRVVAKVISVGSGLGETICEVYLLPKKD